MADPGGGALRREDPGLLTGADRYVADLSFPEQATMVVVRSPVAHARLGEVDVDAARELPGVLGVWSARDVADDLGRVPCIPPRLSADATAAPWLQPVLASDRVRYVGEPVAIVLARDRYIGEDAADLVWPDLEELAVITDPRSPPASEPLFEEGNEVRTMRGGFGDVAAAFAEAPVVVEETLEVSRHTAMPMETRGLAATYDPSTGLLAVHGATKVPHWNRSTLSDLLGIPVDRIQMLETAVGGSFGVRGEFYPEDFLVAWAAMKLGRPVAWAEDRREHLVATNHSREQVHLAALAGDREGRIVGIRSEFWCDLGAYVRTNGLRVPEVTVTTLPGPYDIPHYSATAHCVVTNRTPTGTYRAPGRVESCFVRETLIERYAAQVGIDPVDVRRRNLVRTSQMPYERRIFPGARPVVLEDSDYVDVFDRVLDRIDTEDVEERRGRGECVGVGVGAFLERSTVAPYEAGYVRLLPDGRVRVRSGGTSVGQGVRTVLAQICAEELGVPVDTVDVLPLDTDDMPRGVGSFGSRTTIAAGTAVQLASRRVRDEAKALAGELLGIAPDDLRAVDGGVGTEDGSRRISFAELSSEAEERGAPDGLSARDEYEVDVVSYDFGVHAAVVSVDQDTGGVRTERLVLGFDAGRVMNAKLAAGQLMGGAVQGVGGATLERLAYDPDGNPQTTSFMDYLLPTALEAPEMETVLVEDHPASSNPLGVKGVGEGGITGVPAAIAAAVGRALGRPGSIRRIPVRWEDLAGG